MSESISFRWLLVGTITLLILPLVIGLGVAFYLEDAALVKQVVSGDVSEQVAQAGLANHLAMEILVTTATAAVLAVVIAFVVARITVPPIEALAGVARAVLAGDLSRRARPARPRELRDLALTLNAMLDRIERTLRDQAGAAMAIRRFTADASHELRTPVSVVDNACAVLPKAIAQGDRSEVAAILAVLARETQSMKRILDDLLVLVRLDHSDAAAVDLLVLEELQPLPLLEEVLERTRVLAAGQRIELLWQASSLPRVRADAELLRRALTNLVENAIHATPSGGRITLTAEPKGDACRFVVRDEGRGMTGPELDRVFEPFARGDAGNGVARVGAGLGLAIVRAIAAAHGGRVELSSLPGKGTTAALEIPASRDVAHP